MRSAGILNIQIEEPAAAELPQVRETVLPTVCKEYVLQVRSTGY